MRLEGTSRTGTVAPRGSTGNHAPQVTLQRLTAGNCAQLKKALIAFFSARSYKEGRRARAPTSTTTRDLVVLSLLFVLSQ